MKREVITYNEIEGFHHYPKAPAPVEFLAHKHRHVFVVRCRAEVSHNNREIEIFTEQTKIERLIEDTFDKPANFGEMSCESIAKWLLTTIPELNYAEVLEDGYGGAALTR